MVGVAVRAGDQLVYGQFIAQACGNFSLPQSTWPIANPGQLGLCSGGVRSERGLSLYLPIAEIHMQDGAHHGVSAAAMRRH